MSGNIRLPMVGRVHAGGLTAEQLEIEIASRLKQFLKDPDVSVAITEFRSQPVSVIGAVKNPGVHQLQGRRTLIEILSTAGGLADDAGYSIKITRSLTQGPIPLKTARDDENHLYSVAEVSTQDLLSASVPEDNIQVLPNDVISVPRAETVYVTGTVMRPGGYVLKTKESLSVLQAISLAGGLDRFADTKQARILRAMEGTTDRKEINLDVKLILSNKAPDVPLIADDILFIPVSGTKKIAAKTIESAVQIGTGIAIYGRY